MRNSLFFRSLAGGGGVLTAVLLTMAGCRHQETPSPSGSSPTVAQMTRAPYYVGNEACAGCHPSEYRQHAGTHHAHTLHIIDPNIPTDVDPPRGPIAHTRLIFDTFAGDYQVWVKDNLDRMQPLKLAFGSGKIGITYVEPIDDATLLEMHKSWFPHEHRWATTLGQEFLSENTLGRVRHDARQCMLCHAVTLPDDALMPEPRFQGVGCEACHGPASAHVAAMQSGHTADPHIERIATRDATWINTLCGKCHGTMQSVPDKKHQQLTFRAQPIGLMNSRCFTATRGGLSCLNCHDPHADAATDPKLYEAACLSCHAAQTSTSQHAVPGKPCPVNPRTGCIGCHMPQRDVMPGSQIGATMADHHIAVYRR